MRRLLIVSCIASCTHWTPIRPAQIDNERVLVITSDRAYDMPARRVGDRVEGRPRRAWQTTDCEAGEHDAPTTIATRCRWVPLEPSTGVRIEDESIRDVRAERVAAGRTTLFVLAVAAAIALGVGVWVAYEIKNTNTH